MQLLQSLAHRLLSTLIDSYQLSCNSCSISFYQSMRVEKPLMQTLASQLSCKLSLLYSDQLSISHANSRFSTLINSHANSHFSTLIMQLLCKLSLLDSHQLLCKLSLLYSYANSRFSTLINSHANSRFSTLIFAVNEGFRIYYMQTWGFVAIFSTEHCQFAHTATSLLQMRSNLQ